MFDFCIAKEKKSYFCDKHMRKQATLATEMNSSKSIIVLKMICTNRCAWLKLSQWNWKKKNDIHSWIWNGREKTREYHVDTHQSCYNLQIKMLVWAWWKIQAAYPKSDGYLRMVSAFVSWEFGIEFRFEKVALKLFLF